MLLTKDQILAVEDKKYEIIDVPEWGEGAQVRLAVMTGRDRDHFESESYEVKGKEVKLKYENLRARLLSLTIVDEHGNKIFQKADIEALGMKSAKVLDRLYTIAQSLNGLGAKEAEAAEGN